MCVKLQLRTLTILASIFGIVGFVVFWSRHDQKPLVTLQSDAPTAQGGVPAPAEPSSAAPAVVTVTYKERPAASSTAEKRTDDTSLAAAMHALEESNPARALELARQGQSQWPSGPRAPEFAATEVKCLYRLGKPSEGRGAAEAMVNKYPTSPWADEVERQTGAHRYVNH